MKGTDLMIAKLQEYYGMAYPEGMGKVIVQYLDGLDDSFKPYLMAETFKAQSASFKALPDVKYQPLRNSFGENHVVVELLVTGTLGDGKTARFHACDILTLRDGLIAAKRSYRKVVE